MSIETTYQELLLEIIIRSILSEGSSPSISEITKQFNAYISTHDLSLPVFDSSNYKVDYLSTSSASKFTSCNADIYQDLKVLYRHLCTLSEQNTINFDRWRAESKLLETQLQDLNSRLSSLLLISQDTAGYLNFVQDNFVDLSKTDLSLSNVFLNIPKQYITIKPTGTSPNRIDLSSISDNDVEFTVLTRNSLTSIVPSAGSNKKYAFSDINNYWQEKVYMQKITPVSAELKVKLGSVAATVSRIEVDLHMSNTNSTVQLTPMYSVDNFNWQHIPSDVFTASIRDKFTFQFSPISAIYFKFVFTKQGFDIVHNEQYVYEFGADEIAFYNIGFEEETEYTFISQPLLVTNTKTNLPQEFNKIVLEACEEIPSGTSIEYSVLASNDSTVPTTGATWINIDPLERESPKYPTLLDLGELTELEVTNISISYDPSETQTKFVNPDKDFTLLDSVSGGSLITKSVISSSQRYSFKNSNDYILSHQMSTDIDVAENTLELWRNIKVLGSNNLVRDYPNGWGFKDPYYFCVVDVENPEGTSIDVGSKPIVVDGEPKTGSIDLSYGKHSINVHKDKWTFVDTTGITTLAELKLADSYYPYNHRYLIEGFNYPAGWTEEKTYTGFETVAEFYMKKVSVFDLINNVPSSDYEKFAMDLDAYDPAAISGTTFDKEPSYVFLLKVGENNSDFTNERFKLTFKSVDTLFKYLRLKAVFKTTDSSIAPLLDSYRIKMAS